MLKTRASKHGAPARSAWVTWVLLLCSGCGDGERESRPAPSVVLGTGREQFETMEGEPTLDLAAGFQGGFHVWVSALAYGFEEETLSFELLTQLDGEPGSRLKLGGRSMKFVPTGGSDERGLPGRGVFGYPAQLKNARCAHGKRVHLELTITDSEGRQAFDERYCYAALDPDYRSNNCD